MSVGRIRKADLHIRILFCLHPLEINLVADSANYWCKALELDFTVGASLWSSTELYSVFKLILIHIALITLLSLAIK